MAKKVAKKTSKPSSRQDDPNVVRIKATSAPASRHAEATEATTTTVVKAEKAEKPAKTAKPEKAPKVKKVRGKAKAPRALGATGGYFKGAWYELRQVRWPNRRATWSLTGAVIAYSAFFVVFVLLLDAGFKYLFNLILKQ